MNFGWSSVMARLRRNLTGERRRRRPIRRPAYRPFVEHLDDRTVPAFLASALTVSAGDVNLDGVTDVVAAAGPGSGPEVRLYNGADGKLLTSFFAFESAARGGVTVAVGDFGNGAAIVAGAGQGSGPRVRVFDTNGNQVTEFRAIDDTAFNGGVNVAVADVNGDGTQDVIAGAADGGGPRVSVWDGKTLGRNGRPQKLGGDFFALDVSGRGGVYVAGGDTNADGRADIFAGSGPNAGGELRVLSGTDRTQLRSLRPYGPSFAGGVTVAARDVNGDSVADIVTGAGVGGGPQVSVFNGKTGGSITSFFAYDSKFRGGVSVGSSFGPDNNLNLIVTGPLQNGGPNVKGFAGAAGTPLFSFLAFDTDTPNPNFTVPGPDKTGPVVTISSPADGFTTRSNPTISGSVTDARSGVASLQAAVNSGTPQAVTVAAGGAFTFTPSLVTDGTADGPQAVTFTATDTLGNVTTRTFNFTLDTSAPTQPVFDLDPAFATAPQETASATVTLVGTADPDATLTLVQTGATATADGAGKFAFTNVALQPGANTLTVRSTDGADSSEFTRTITRNARPTQTQAVANVNVRQGAQPTLIDLSQNFGDADIVNSLVRFNTSEGAVDIELFDQKAPLSVNNFLDSYITTGRYDNTIFERLVPGFVLQGGSFSFDPADSMFDPVPTDPPVLNEFSPDRSNLRGTVAFAKRGGDPNSATSAFFFNLADNSANLDNQNGGFTVFGEVSDETLPVVDAIAALPTRDFSRTLGGSFASVPLKNYNGTNFPTDATAANFALVSGVSVLRRSDQLSFSVTANSNPGLVTASVAGNRLTLNYADGQTGASTITVTATDRQGATVTATFTVTVTP